MDKYLNQSVSLVGSDNKVIENSNQTKSDKINPKDLSNIENFKTKISIDSKYNYDYIVNSMFSFCTPLCLKNFNVDTMTKSEEICIENCHYKYMNIVGVGVDCTNFFLEREARNII